MKAKEKLTLEAVSQCKEMHEFSPAIRDSAAQFEGALA